MQLISTPKTVYLFSRYSNYAIRLHLQPPGFPWRGKEKKRKQVIKGLSTCVVPIAFHSGSRSPSGWKKNLQIDSFLFLLFLTFRLQGKPQKIVFHFLGRLKAAAGAVMAKERPGQPGCYFLGNRNSASPRWCLTHTQIPTGRTHAVLEIREPTDNKHNNN